LYAHFALVRWLENGDNGGAGRASPALDMA